MKKYIYLLGIVLVFAPIFLHAQNLQVQGIVKDNKESIAGATILEKGTTNGTVTDANGNFKITLKQSPAILTVRFLGYLTKEIGVSSGSKVTVTLDIDAKGLEEVIVVGYAQKKQITNIGAVSQISGSAISDVPNSNIQNTLAGRLPGFSSQQRSGQPGRDGANFFIRGVNSLNGANNPLIIVDDVEYTYSQVSQLDANEVESISILKDASTTAIYGIKGANGVLVITTKRGKAGKPQFNFSSEYGINQMIRMPRFLSSYEVATLRNEADANDGLPADFTQADLDLFQSGADPYGHPNTNWVGDLFTRSAPQTNYNLDISGGTSIVKYFINLGAFTQDGQLRNLDPSNQVDPTYFYNRQTFRSNLDITPNKRLNLRIDISGRLTAINEPQGVVSVSGGTKDIWNSLYTYALTNPFMLDSRNPNGTWASNKYQTGASIASLVAEDGYLRSTTNDLNLTLAGSHQMDFLAKGLVANLNVAYSSSSSDTRTLSRGTIPAFTYNSVANTYTNTNNLLQTPAYAVGGGNGALIRTLSLKPSISYDRTLGNHHVTGLLLYNQTSATDRFQLPVNFTGLTGRLGYDFKNKYLFEVTLARNGSDKYQGSKRYGIFPAVAVGWNIAEETAFQNKFPFVDVFKLRGTYGLVGSDQGPAGGITSQVYSVSGTSYNFGATSNTVSGIVEGPLINTDINWEQERQADIGIDLVLWKKLKITADYFNRYRYDQVITPTNVSLILGQTLGQYNLGKSEDQGYEFELTYNGKVGKVAYYVSPQLSYTKNKVIYSGIVAAYPYLSQDGRPIGMSQGYIADGFYTQADIDAINAGQQAKPLVPVKAGYLKYEDLNGDGVIDAKDQSLIGKPNNPTTTAGLDLGISYKGFRADVLFQGASGYNVRIFSQGGDPFNSNLQPIHLERWTPATAATALYPILSTKADSYNYSFLNNSTFWMVDTKYVRLKQVQLSYTLPSKFVQAIHLRNVTLTASGYNLVTWNNYNQYQQDAESSSSTSSSATDKTQTSSPNARQYVFGIRVGF